MHSNDYVTRKVVKVFEEQGIRITVMVSSHSPFQRFGFKLESVRHKVPEGGAKVGDTYTIPYVNPRIIGQKTCQVELDSTIEIVKDLLDLMKEFILTEAGEEAEVVRAERERYDVPVEKSVKKNRAA